MKYKEILDDIYDYCRWDRQEKVTEILEEASVEKLDILYDEGVLLKIALTSENLDLLRVLLDYYYEEYKLNDKPIEDYTLDQSAAKYRLYQILQESYVPEDIIVFLKKEYSINLAEDNSSVGDLEEEYEVDLIEKNGSQSTTDHNNSSQKEEILKDIVNHHFSGELLTSHNIQLLGQEGIVETKNEVVVEDIKDHQI